MVTQHKIKILTTGGIMEMYFTGYQPPVVREALDLMYQKMIESGEYAGIVHTTTSPIDSTQTHSKKVKVVRRFGELEQLAKE